MGQLLPASVNRWQVGRYCFMVLHKPTNIAGVGETSEDALTQFKRYSGRRSISAAATRSTSACFTSSIPISTRARRTAPARLRPP